MTVAPFRPAPRSAPSSRPAWATDPRLSGLLAALSALQMSAQQITDRVAGETDTRVLVGHQRWPVTVELLWTSLDGPRPESIDAVRIWRDDRAVWRHLAGDWVAADVARFITNLVVLPPSLLRRRYHLLG